jgi:hypothetical protein
LDWIGFNWIGLDSIRFDSIQLDWIGLDSVRSSPSPFDDNPRAVSKAEFRPSSVQFHSCRISSPKGNWGLLQHVFVRRILRQSVIRESLWEGSWKLTRKEGFYSSRKGRVVDEMGRLNCADFPSIPFDVVVMYAIFALLFFLSFLGIFDFHVSILMNNMLFILLEHLN